MIATYREQILTRAIDKIHEKGWNKGSAYGPQKQVCVAIAVNDSLEFLRDEGVIPDSEVFAQASLDVHLAILRVATETTGLPWGAVSRWNDDPVLGCQSADQAIETMKRAIDVAVLEPILGTP